MSRVISTLALAVCSVCSVCSACSSKGGTPRDIARVEAPREVFAAYHVGGLRIEGAPPLDRSISKGLAPFVTAPHARVLDFDGSLLASAHGDCVEISADVITDRLLGRSRPIAEAVRGCDAVEWAGYSADHHIAFVADRDGDERSALFLLGDKPAMSPVGRVSEPIWDRARTRLVFGFAGDREGELWMWERGKPARRIAGAGPWAPLDTSQDGRVVLARRELATNESALYRIDVQTGAAIALTEVGGVATTHGRFTENGDLIAVTDRGGDRRSLALYSHRSRTLLAADLDAEVTDFVIVDETVVFVTSAGGASALRELDLATGAHRVMVGAPTDGVISDLRRTDSGAIAFSFSNPTTSRKIVVMLPRATQTGVNAVMRWPDAPAVKRATPAAHEVVASDGVRSSLLAYLPAKTKAPVLIDLHGGPEDRWLPRYDGFVQFLVARGHAVIQPNVRGSAGQGRAFSALDNGKRREDPLRDVAAVLDWIATRPELDGTRVVVMGTSYGGYLALAALHAFPERLRGGITLGAITDFIGFLEGTAAWRRDHRRAEYGDERDPDTRAFLANISPLTRVAQLKRPLMMAYGLRDPRVPAATSAQFVRAARATGVNVWSMVASDEGHWFVKGDNRDAFEVLAVQFLASL